MILRLMRELLAIMREDPKIAPELPVVRKYAVRTFAWLLLTESVLVLQFYPIKFFIDELARPAPRVGYLLGIAGSMLVIYKLSSLIRGAMSRPRNAMFWRMWRVWWGYGHRRELRLSSDWHTKHSTGEKESLVGKNIAKFEYLVDELLFETVPAGLRIFFTVILMFLIGWQYGLVAFLTVIVFGWVIRRSEQRIKPLREDMRRMMKPIEAYGTEMTANWRTIKAIGREEDFSDRNDDMLMELWESEHQRHRTFMKHIMRQEDVITVSRAILYGTIGLSVLWQQPSLGTVVLASTWMERAYSNSGRFTDFQRRLNEGLEAMRELITLMCLPPTVQQAAAPQWPEQVRGAVVFDDVSFAYPESDGQAIRGVSLVAEPYTSTALVGYSGCGKTTLMALLQREYDPDIGRILIDGIDLREVDYQRYRRELVGVVSQDVQLFNATVAENIRITKPDATDEEVREAARRAYAHEFIVQMEKGYDTLIGEDGIRLSGGQRQRLAIARALIRKPAILIMDEATSALDAISQQKIQTTIDDLIAARSCTIFIIAHRFSTIMSADRVAVLEDGRLAEIGTHSELVRQNGLYARLRDMESRGLLD